MFEGAHLSILPNPTQPAKITNIKCYKETHDLWIQHCYVSCKLEKEKVWNKECEAGQQSAALESELDVGPKMFCHQGGPLATHQACQNARYKT